MPPKPYIDDFRLATPSEIVGTLGARLREQRLSQVITQEEVARRAGVSVGAIKKLESSGKVTVETLVLVAQVLGLVEDLSALFKIRPQTSIAEMERYAASQRQRARSPRAPRQ